MLDVSDDGRLSAQLERRSGIGAGVAVVRPTPRIDRERHLAVDLMVALGKRHDALARERYTSPDAAWHLVDLWFRAELIRDLVVLHAGRLAPELRNEVALTARGCGARLWFAVTPTQPVPTTGVGPVPSSELLDALPVRRAPTRRATIAARAREVVTPACACALASVGITGRTVSDVAHLPIGSINLAFRVLTIGTTRWTVPLSLAAPIRAQLLVRSADTTADDPLFVNEWRRQASPYELHNWLERATSRGPNGHLERFFPHTIGGRRLTIVGSVRHVNAPSIGYADRVAIP